MQVTDVQAAAVVGTYSYDGLHRRNQRTTGGVTWQTFYSDQWKPLEERRHAVGAMREKSKAVIQAKPAEIMDVNETAVRLTRRGVLMSSEVLCAVV